METVIRINTDDLGSEIIEGIKKLFPHKTVEITIQPADEIEYIMSNAAYADELLTRLDEYNKTKVLLM